MQTLKEQIEEIELKHQSLIQSNHGLSNTTWGIPNVPMEELKEYETDMYKLDYYDIVDQYMMCCCTKPVIFAYSGDGKVSYSKHNIDELYSPI